MSVWYVDIDKRVNMRGKRYAVRRERETMFVRRGNELAFEMCHIPNQDHVKEREKK